MQLPIIVRGGASREEVLAWIGLPKNVKTFASELGKNFSAKSALIKFTQSKKWYLFQKWAITLPLKLCSPDVWDTILWKRLPSAAYIWGAYLQWPILLAAKYN